MTDNEFTAWCAGFFDGEGTVYIRTVNWTNDRVDYYLHAQITQGVREPLDRIRAIFPGNIAKHGKKYFRLNYEAKKAVRFLEAIYPYTIVKQEVIKLALEFANTIHYVYGNTNDEQARRIVKAKREKIKLAMSELNRSN